MSDGIEKTALQPGWAAKENRIQVEDIDDELTRIFIFYVLESPCCEVSCKGIELKKYGWDKRLWKDNKLKDRLFSVAGLVRGTSFVVAKKCNDMKRCCEQVNLKSDFNRLRYKERVVIYKGNDNEFISICRHIRNSLAHGRFAIYKDNHHGDIFVMEDGVKKDGKIEVRARMILKKSTLITWINILTRTNSEKQEVVA